jgi:lauroyl/myristoyl acyltransferase
MYAAYRTAVYFAPKLPRRLRRILSVVIGSLSWIFASRERGHVTANVRQVIGRTASRSFAGRLRTQLVARRVFCNCIDNYFELFALSDLTKNDVASRLDFRGTEHAFEAFSYGQGIVLFSAHLGPFECLPFVIVDQLSNYDFPCELVIPVEKMNDERLLSLMLKMRRKRAIEFVPLDGVAGILAMLDALRKRQIVVVTADRAIKGRTKNIEFFGASTRLPQGAIDLAVRTGAPLLGAFAWRGPGGRIVCEFTRLTFALPAEQRGDPHILRLEVARQLETFIGAHVDEWMVFERVWKE